MVHISPFQQPDFTFMWKVQLDNDTVAPGGLKCCADSSRSFTFRRVLSITCAGVEFVRSSARSTSYELGLHGTLLPDVIFELK